MNAPWVFAEAYKYRRLRECFSISKYWKDYDVFFRQKVRDTLPAFLPWSSTVHPSAIPFRVHKTQYLNFPCGSRRLLSYHLGWTNKLPRRRNISCSMSLRRVRLHVCREDFLPDD